MKVLYSCLSKSWGGMEMFTLTAVQQLLKNNISVELLCINESRIHIEANNLGIIIHIINNVGYFHPISILSTASVIKNGKFDLIHTQASKDLWIIVPALNLLNSKIPLFLTKQLNSFIVKKDVIHKTLYNRVTKIFAISNAVKKNVLDTCPVTEDKVELLHNGIDISRFNPEKANRKKVRDEFEVEDDEMLIGMMARFSPGKGHEEFIEAAKILSDKYNNLKFLIVGEASRGEDEYANKIKKLAIEKELVNIIFAGFRSDTPDVLSAMDIFVFPSHSEAFGIALAEALAMGVPSVCSDEEGVLDIAVNNETSLLFKTKNSLDLAEKIEVLIKNKELRNSFSEHSRLRALKFFDINILTDKVINVYKSFI
ncbi:MAG: glycosyltransferase family 4 protein [Syntrophothermus sp.]